MSLYNEWKHHRIFARKAFNALNDALQHQRNAAGSHYAIQHLCKDRESILQCQKEVAYCHRKMRSAMEQYWALEKEYGGS